MQVNRWLFKLNKYITTLVPSLEMTSDVQDSIAVVSLAEIN